MEPAIAPRRRSGAGRNFLLGMALGGLGAALFWHFYPGFWKDPPAAAAPAAAALERRAALLAHARAPRPAAAASVDPVAPRSACGSEPLIPAASAADGRLRMEHPFPAEPRAKAKVFLRLARKAAADGRTRDAEVALIAACRYNDQASAAPTVPLASVLGLLGDRYIVAAAGDTLPERREQLLERAREVLALSAQTYAQALGPNASRSREARRRVAALAEGLVVAADAPGPMEPAGPTASVQPSLRTTSPAASPRTTAPPRSSERPPVSPVAPREPAPMRPGPELAREASDPELRQLASDLARLRAQAEAVSEDPAGLRRRAERAQAQRTQCADAACLRDWYARRRQELLAEF